MLWQTLWIIFHQIIANYQIEWVNSEPFCSFTLNCCSNCISNCFFSSLSISLSCALTHWSGIDLVSVDFSIVKLDGVGKIVINLWSNNEMVTMMEISLNEDVLSRFQSFSKPNSVWFTWTQYLFLLLFSFFSVFSFVFPKTEWNDLINRSSWK